MDERTCSAPEGCARTDVVGYDGLCRKHYGRKRKHGTTELPDRTKPPCWAPDCGRPPKTRGLCAGHYSRLLKTGSVRADVPLRPVMREIAAEKRCSTCGITKPLDGFAPDNRRRDGRQARCRECVKAYQKRYRNENRDRYLELKRAEYERSKPRALAYKRTNKDRIRRQRHLWQASLPSNRIEAIRVNRRSATAAYRARNSDECNRRIRDWKRANPDKSSEYRNLRRARKRRNGTPERFTRTEIGERDGWICGICDKPVDKTLRFPDQQSPSLDHVVPLALGGEHSRANSRITHWICNVRRNIGQSAA